MKTVKMQGGIGNQLFCLAFARSVTRLSREPVAIDLASFSTDRYGHAFALEDLAAAIEGVNLVRRPLLRRPSHNRHHALGAHSRIRKRRLRPS